MTFWPVSNCRLYTDFIHAFRDFLSNFLKIISEMYTVYTLLPEIKLLRQRFLFTRMNKIIDYLIRIIRID